METGNRKSVKGFKNAVAVSTGKNPKFLENTGRGAGRMSNLKSRITS